MATFDYKGGDYRQIAVTYSLEDLAKQIQLETKPNRKKWLLDALTLKDKVDKIWSNQSIEEKLKALNDSQQDYEGW